MAAFVVMQPPNRDGADSKEPPVFVHDGFSLVAFLVPPLWLLWHRLWIEAAAALILAIAIGSLGAWLGPANGMLSLFLSLYVGLENGALRVNALRRRGWNVRAVIEAESSDEAEIRYFMADDPVAQVAPPVPAQPSVPSQRMPIAPSAPALGLLSYPGRG
jgi:hypothetical protein